ncbi:MAG TPA: cupin domain-containing protein [Streptosporangiaceae bacterium]|jgi:quercetin dioxygenase-like cupin family protein|nr:cupin domain-containing protein [Streptosporangiaceae bacterium]
MTGPISYVRAVDLAAVAALAGDERYSQKLIDRSSGGEHASVAYIRTPPGGGSPRGLHSHLWEQIFYVLEGEMTIEVAGQRSVVGPGNLIVFPAGVPHRNWNASDSPTVHLAVNTPLPLAKSTRDTPAIPAETD